MENKRILHLAKLSISRDDLKNMKPHELAFLSTMAFAVDEVSIFLKLYSQSIARRPKDETAVLLWAIQHNTIARVLAAKLFEAIGMLEKYLRSKAGIKAKNGCEVLRDSEAQLDLLRNMSGFSLATEIRNDATNHYIPSVVEKNIPYVSNRAQYVAILDEMQGNSYYPFGEEVVFLGRIGRFFAERHDRAYTMNDLDDWYDWIVATSKWLNKMFYSYVLWLYRNRFSHWRLAETKPYLEMELFAEIGEQALPLFFSADIWKTKRNQN